MIKMAFDVPFKFVDYANKGDILYILPFLTKYKEYYDFFKNTKKYKIIDNGLIEKQIFKREALIKLAIDLKVDEIVAYDSFESGGKTIKLTEDFITKYFNVLKKHNIKIMGVIHGKNLTDYFDTLQYMYNNSFIDVIGIPFQLINIIKESSYNDTTVNTLLRLEITQYMEDNQLIAKPVHLLGCYNPVELKYQKKHDFVRSVDTSSPIICAINNIYYDKEKGILQKPRYNNNYYYLNNFKEETKQIIDYNINIMKRWGI